MTVQEAQMPFWREMGAEGRRVLATVESFRRHGQLLNVPFGVRRAVSSLLLGQAVGHLDVSKNVGEKKWPRAAVSEQGQKRKLSGGHSELFVFTWKDIHTIYLFFCPWQFFIAKSLGK